MEGEPLRVAIVGLGRWGPHYVRVLSSLPSARVVALVDIDPARLEQVGHLQTSAKRFRTCQDMLQSETPVDAVVLATPASTHFDLVSMALEARKHVLCEKPLCITPEECHTLGRMAEHRGLVLMVGYVFLFNFGILKLNELMDNGELGKLRYLSARRTNLGPVRSDVGACLDLATHDISICNFIFGSLPSTVSAVGAEFLGRHEDVTFITLKYPGGILANIEASWLSPRKIRRITVVGSEQMAVWDDLDPESPLALYDVTTREVEDTANRGEFRIHVSWGNVRIPFLTQPEPLLEQVKCFVECAKTGRAPAADASFAANVTAVAQAARQSMRNGGAPAHINHRENGG